jgi:hypothetical protein
VAIVLAMVVALWEQLLIRDRGLNERESALVTREDNVVAVERALGKARMECDAERDRVKAVR